MPHPSLTRRSFGRLTAAAVFAGLTASACGTSEDKSTTATAAGADAAAFPVTIDNTFGATTIETKPERVLTLGWNAQDVVYALGLTPVRDAEIHLRRHLCRRHAVAREEL